MDNNVPNHKAIMEALLTPLKHDLDKNQANSCQPNGETPKDKHLHCLIIDTHGPDLSKNVCKELAKILIAYRPKKVTSKTESICSSQESTGTGHQGVGIPSAALTDSDKQECNQEFHSLHGNTEVEKLDVGNFFQNYIKFILEDTDTSNDNNVLFIGLRYLAQNLKDTKVTSLDLGWNEMTCDVIKSFAQNLQNSNLISLILHGNRIDEDDENDLYDAFEDTGLSVLDLEANPIVEPLWYLRDFMCDPEEYDMDYIIKCQNNPEKTSLYVAHSKKIKEDGPDFLSPILKNSNITDLDLTFNDLKCRHLKFFAPSLVDTKITHLNLAVNELGFEGIKYLASVLKNTQITNLNLEYNSLTCKSLRNLIMCLPETKIKELNLGGNDICCNAFYLASVLKDTQISDLNLSGWGTTKNNYLKHFIKSWKATDNFINLNGQNVCSVVLYNISYNLKKTDVTHLELSNISINNDDLKYLCLGLVGSKVTLLDLSENNINCKGFQHLFDVLEKTRISELDLANNKMSCDSLKHLSQVLPLTQISKLNLANNAISCNGVNYLLKGLEQVTSLDLSSNPIGNDGIECLSQHLHHTKIVELKLCKIKIDCNGAQYLAQALKRTQISKLRIAENKISSKGLKYLLESIEGSQLASLDLSDNPLETNDIEYLARNLEHSKIVELFLWGFEFSCETAHQLCETVVNCSKRNLVKIYMNFAEDISTDETIPVSGSDLLPTTDNLQENNDDISEENLWDEFDYDGYDFFSTEEVPSNKDDEDNVPSQNKRADYLIRIPGYHLEINHTGNISKIEHLMKNVYQKSGVTKLIFGFLLDQSKLTGAFDNIYINELCLIEFSSLRSDTVSLFEKSNIAEFMFHYTHFFVQDDLDLLENVSQLKFISLNLKNIKPLHLPALQLALMRSGIRYLDLSDNELGDTEFEMLTNILPGSRIISLNLSGNNLGVRSVELLAQVLPHTRITYIDLHRNNIGYTGFKCLMNAVDKTDVCLLELSDNNIESSELQDGVNLSPYIVPRTGTPIGFKIRYIFREVVSMNTVSGEFEFVVLGEDSNHSITLNCYPQLVKSLMETPDSNIHLYDLFYMENKRHDIGVMDKINNFMEDMKQRFYTFIEKHLFEFEPLFGHDCYIDLVKECDALELKDFVEFLLLHRVLYYVDNEQSILHPFIYKMLHKYGMPLFNEDLEPNKREQIVDFFLKHPEIDGIDIIDLMSELPSKQ